MRRSCSSAGYPFFAQPSEERNDALLNYGEQAVLEAKTAVELLPTSVDAMDGPGLEMNLAVVYSWTNQLDLAFEVLSHMTKVPNGIYYGQLKHGPYWYPLREDRRFGELLADLAPQRGTRCGEAPKRGC